MEDEARTATFVGRVAQPSILATYHLSDDQTARELAGPLALDARFPIGSVAKTLAALLVVRLCVDGVVDWDEPLATGGSPPTGSLALALTRDDAAPVTLRVLLGHTARVPFEFHPDHWGRRR